MTDLYLVRHGETEWSRNGRHTSITDLDLTENGREQAESLRPRLNPDDFGLVLSSPRKRALRTAELAGFPDPVIDDDLAEWYYGQFEGLSSVEIRAQVPSWRIWTSHIPGGEQSDEVVERLSRVVNRVRFSGVERAIVFGHGHALRVLALTWVGVSIAHGGAFPLKTGSLSVLGYEKESSAILQWNL
ncbi:MAG: histidine phosphatase family protein [Propionibacteriaceae bacterium]|jgi:probable phosphoglycerate mutase|nr:histidine phosphatase family protein [Propionibacteriaceae bacterium]